MGLLLILVLENLSTSDSDLLTRVVTAKSASSGRGVNAFLYPPFAATECRRDLEPTEPRSHSSIQGVFIPWCKAGREDFFVIFASLDTCYDNVLNKTNYYFPHASQFNCNNPVI